MKLYLATLLERLERDQFTADSTDPYERGWCAATKHVIGILRMESGLAEVEHDCDDDDCQRCHHIIPSAKAVDLRVRHEMTGQAELERATAELVERVK